MSTAQKPEALRLADKFEVNGFLSDYTFAQNQWCSQAAVELRRLHAENLELRAQNDFFEAIKSIRTYAIPMETDGLRNSCRK